MKTNDIIVLDNNQKYTLLASVELDGDTYFLAGLLDENDNFDPKNTQIVKAIYEGEEKFVDVIADKDLITKLTVEFQKVMKD